MKKKMQTSLVILCGLAVHACGDDEGASVSSPPVPTDTPANAGGSNTGAGPGPAADAGAMPESPASPPGAGGSPSLPGGSGFSSEARTIRPLLEGWKFIQDDDLADEDALAGAGEDWQSVELPHTWNAEDAASLDAEDYARGLGWYRLEFDSPEGAGRHYLEFGAAALVADVWLNGKKIGEHEGGFTQFRFDVSGALAASGSNVLLVKVDNTAPEENDDRTAIAPLGGDFNVFGGLYRHVALISTSDAAHFDLDDLGASGVYASSTLAAGTVVADGASRTADATVHVRARVTNQSPAAGEYTARVSLRDDTGQVAATQDQPVQVEAGETREVSLDIDLPSAHLWHGMGDPFMYQLVAELIGPKGSALDSVIQGFGVREMTIDSEQGLFLNGEKQALRGAAIHQDQLGKGWAIDNADLDASFAVLTEMGANAVRLGHYPFSQYALQRASELGLVAWAEATLGVRTAVERCRRAPAPERFVSNAQQQQRESIRQLYNYPAIAVWAVGNESTQGQLNCEDRFDNVTPVIEAMNQVAKEEDPTRPTAYAEFPHPVQRSGPFATEGITDTYATNRYFLWYTQEFEAFGPMLDELHTLAAGQALAVSEYGGGAAFTHHTDNPRGGYPEVRSASSGAVSYQPEEYQAWLHEQNWQLLTTKPYLWATFIWNLFDFGSAHRNEGDVLGVNTKGLVGFDHQTKKDAFYFYKANWSSEPVTYITSRRYTDRAYPVADIKVYSNADSVALTVNGAVVGTMLAEECPQRACVFEEVRLSPGANSIEVSGDHAGEPVTDSVEWTMNASGINIAAGRLATGYVSTQGTRFGSDDFFSGGEFGYIDPGVDPGGGVPEDITGTEDPELYKWYRSGDFSYSIPLADGSYELTLGFVELDEGVDEGDRIFDVLADGEPLIEGLDVISEAGERREVITRSFDVDVSGGRLVLEFTPAEGSVDYAALVSTIKLVRASGAPE
jgi:beta-galactosidase